jgi:four helix bundle protein
MTTKTFHDLLAWQEAHKFVLTVYRVTETFPKSELFGLTSQMRRAAVSIPANIAEGYKRRSKAAKVRILNIAQGSVEESRYYLILMRDLSYADPGSLPELLETVSKLLGGYIKGIERSQPDA